MNNMNPIRNLKNSILQIITLSKYIQQKTFLNLRYLDTNNKQQTSFQTSSQRKDNQKKQLYEIYIYLSILLGIMIIILVGYCIYRKYVEKQALREVNEENQNINNFYNSISAVFRKSKSWRIFPC